MDNIPEDKVLDRLKSYHIFEIESFVCETLVQLTGGGNPTKTIALNKHDLARLIEELKVVHGEMI